jgi:hypothetical protein
MKDRRCGKFSLQATHTKKETPLENKAFIYPHDQNLTE